MNPPSSPIKRHEVFLIIALLFLNLAYAAKPDWEALVLVFISAVWIIAFFIALIEDKT